MDTFEAMPSKCDPDPENRTSGAREKSAKSPTPILEVLPVRKRHSPEQIASSLRQAEAGVPVAEIIRKLGIHENTFYTWKRRFGGFGTPDIRESLQLRARPIMRCATNWGISRSRSTSAPFSTSWVSAMPGLVIVVPRRQPR